MKRRNVRSSSTSQVRDKHFKLDQAKLEKARSILGTDTERETVEQALDLVISEEELNRVLEELKGKARIKKIFR